MAKEKKVTIITGMSGAGKSVALKTFEDLSFEAIDNMPLSVLPNILQNLKEKMKGKNKVWFVPVSLHLL